MKNLLKMILASFLLIVLVGCGNKTKYDEYKEEGNVITVRYEANGGTYLDREGITLIDMFNPADYASDTSGVKHIKLVNPTSSKRKEGGASSELYITRTNYFLVGWYQNREIRKVNGKVVDENGNALVEKDNEYYLESDGTTKSTPAYDYSGMWDFDNDTIEFTADMDSYEMTLYAVWLPHFEFCYYAENEAGEWEKIGSTPFDYVTTNKEGSTSYDYDTIFVPTWVDGAMSYTHKYHDNGNYNFPKKTGYTFNSAYLDQACTQKITESFEHQGSINYENGTAINPVQNIYVKYDKGNYYYISNAEELVKNADLTGIYTIMNDLDFASLTWPTIFEVGTFKGSIVTDQNKEVVFKNLNIKHSSDTAKYGGVFGKIASEATIKNITFENVIFDLSYVGKRNNDTNFGLFAGLIEENAKLENIKVSGTMNVGAITLGNDYSINLVANGEIKNVTTLETIHLNIYGTKSLDQFTFTIDTENVTIDEDGFITFVSVTNEKKTQETFNIQ